jgi:hypothetical protein
MNKLIIIMMSCAVALQILATINMQITLSQKRNEMRAWCNEQKVATMETYKFCRDLLK